MLKKKQTTLAANVDYVTVLIIAFFVLLTIAVFIYFKQRINAINGEINQRSHNTTEIRKSIIRTSVKAVSFSDTTAVNS